MSDKVEVRCEKCNDPLLLENRRALQDGEEILWEVECNCGRLNILKEVT